MVDPKLLGYIKQKTSAGIAKEVVTSTLLQAGWAQGEVEEAFKEAGPTAAPASVTEPATPPPVIKSQVPPGEEPARIIERHQLPTVEPFPVAIPKRVIPLALIISAGAALVVLLGLGAYLYADKSGLFAVSSELPDVNQSAQTEAPVEYEDNEVLPPEIPSVLPVIENAPNGIVPAYIEGTLESKSPASGIFYVTIGGSIQAVTLGMDTQLQDMNGFPLFPFVIKAGDTLRIFGPLSNPLIIQDMSV